MPPGERAFRTSPRQRRLWELRQSGVPTGAAATLRLSGPLDRDALERAVRRVAERHEVLRTAVLRRRGVKTAVQVILPEASPRFEIADGDGNGGASTLETGWRAAEGADPEEGRPLTAVLTPLSGDEHRLDLRLPALAADVRSLLVLAQEIADAYEAETGGRTTPAEDGEEPVQYLQYSEWQNALVEEREEEGAAYWGGRDLSALDDLRLPLEREAAPAPAERVELRMDAGGAAVMDEVAERLGSEPGPLLLAVWLALVARSSGRTEPVVAHVFPGRRFPQLESALGAFAQAAPVGVDLADDPSLKRLLPRVERALQQAGDRMELYEPEERSGIGFESVELPPDRSRAGVSFRVEAAEAWSDRLRHKLTAVRRDGALDLVFEHDPAALGREPAAAVLRAYRRLLETAVEDPAAPLGALPILAPEERRAALGDSAATATEYPRERLVHQLFEEQAARTPEAVALRGDGDPVSYRELDAMAERLARALRRAGAGPEGVVALHARRGAGLVAGVLGTLKAGAAFLPLDPGLPPERLRGMLEDAGARVLLGGDGDLGEPDGVRRVPLSVSFGEEGEEAPEGKGAPGAGGSATPESLAYVLYTSGSTGRPKGVMVPHRGLVNYLSWARERYPSGEGTAVPLHSSIAFDLTLTSLFVPLISGGTVVLVPEDEGLEALAGDASEGAFAFVKLTPSHVELLRRQVADDEHGVLARLAGTFVLGGEALYGELLSPWSDDGGTRLINEYGPTETVVGCAAFEARGDGLPDGRVPIGRPIANTRLYVLDRYLEPVPHGAPGLLFIGGDGAARGYLGRRGVTAAAFVPDPFGGEAGGRLYASGDLARLRADGELEFLGRADHQVKIRGYRLEPGEVETLLRRHPSVAEAVVVVREDEPGNRLLVAYLVHRGPRPSVTELRGFLREVLPEPLVPNAFVPLDALPLTPSGKVDRRALPVPETRRPDLEERFVAPETEVEKVIAEMWREVLKVDRVGTDDDFFELGGHSLLATQVISRVRHHFDVDLEVRTLFDAPTVAAWARWVEEARKESAEGLDQVLDEVKDLPDDEVDRLLEELRG